MDDEEFSQKTKCIHAGTYIDPATGGINSPIFTSTAYEYIDRAENQYPRYFNIPNHEVLTKKISALEYAEDGLIFSSGMAAISCSLLSLLQNGDHAVFQSGLYGGTHNFILTELNKFGIDYVFAKSYQIEDFENEIKENTKVIYLESPSNPLLEITDIEKIAAIAKRKGIITIIDNTFASPINQNPIKYGIDIVIHSGTKYLSGHSDISCGAALSSKSLIKTLKSTALNFGGNLNAQTCYLLERSLKTLFIRVKQQNENAMVIAKYLEELPFISKVYYPGLESNEGYNIAKNQMKGFGGMLSFELAADFIKINTFLKKLKILKPAVSLGGVESTICEPAKTSHAKMERDERLKIGVTDELLRISAGIEDADDLIADLRQAFT